MRFLSGWQLIVNTPFSSDVVLLFSFSTQMLTYEIGLSNSSTTLPLICAETEKLSKNNTSQYLILCIFFLFCFK
ncbi:hypothetical protein [Flavobacterium sp. 25HG05S-40]|uniref:hypothetical protein n=1 Tax=Flavobacterium sp. 25HG05S-40 TaxID=3458682 RepID=UPI004043ED6B